MKTIHVFSLVALFLVGCNSNQEIISETTTTNDNLVSAIQPIEGLEKAVEQFRVSANAHDTIYLNNGGSIVFEENSFVDKNGNLITGDVDVQWQEFHSLADILVSGIPMKYDSAGVEHDFVSGGMFTISATQKDEPVEIAPGKSATVNLVSQQDTPCYNFYELDEETGDWAYETTQVGEKVEDSSEEVVEDNSIDNALLDIRLDTRKFTELEGVDIVAWKLANPLSNKEKLWLEANRSKAKLLEGNGQGAYAIEIKSGKEHKLFQVQPYTLEDAMSATRSNEREFQKEMSEIIAYQQKLAAGKIVRTIAIDNFGTYNWDIVCKRANSERLIADFQFPGNVNKDLVSLFLISPDENAIIKYDANGDSKFSYDPDLRNCLVAILPSNELVVVDADRFVQNAATKRGKSCTFKFEKTGVKLKSSQDVSNYLDRLI